MQCRQSYTAADCVDQHPLFRSQASLSRQSIVRGHKNLRDRGRFFPGEVLRDAHRFALVDYHVLRVSSSRDDPHDPVADRPQARAGSQRIYLTSVLEARNLRGCSRWGWVQAPALQYVRAVERRCPHPHPDLAGPRLGHRMLPKL